MMLLPTPPERLTDRQGRPYFFWDCELTLAQLQQALEGGDDDIKAYLVAKLMRQAKPDDVLVLLPMSTIRAFWPRVHSRLGRARAFWEWLLSRWQDDRSNG